jgi:excisionase family DNA binding protein
MTTAALPEQPARGRAHQVRDLDAMAEVLVYDYDRAAAALGVSTSFLRKEVMAGRIMHSKLGRCVRFTRAHLDAYLAATEQPMVVRSRRRRL